MSSVMQKWTHDLTLMQQSVLISAVRGPDGMRKDHVSKLLIRWLRRCILRSAFSGDILATPAWLGGGSFTGPSCRVEDGEAWQPKMDAVLDEYLSTLDEVPHHFQLHFLHASEILGYKHPDGFNRHWWHRTYLRLVNDMHLNPESELQMDKRLGDIESQWREAEEVTAVNP